MVLVGVIQDSVVMIAQFLIALKIVVMKMEFVDGKR